MKRKTVREMMLTLFLASALTVASSEIPYALADVEVLFEENFEGYALGSFPSDKFYARWGGWSVTEEGGNKFLRSVPYTDSNYDMTTIQKFPGNVTIEFLTRHSQGWLYVDITNSLDPIPGVFSFAIYTDGTQYVIYYHWTSDGIIYVAGGAVLGTFTTQPNIWYKETLELVGTLAKFYVNDLFVFEYDISTVIPFPIENFHLYWGTWGQRDLDNIKVYRPSPTLTITMTNIKSGSTETITLELIDEDHDGLVTIDIENRILAAIRRTHETTTFDFPEEYTATKGAWMVTLSSNNDYAVTLT